MYLLVRRIAVRGADDSSIRNPVPNDLRPILEAAPIAAIFTTGKKAYSLYRRHILPTTGREALCLPSTSPANCRYETIDTLTEAYKIILPYLHTQ